MIKVANKTVFSHEEDKKYFRFKKCTIMSYLIDIVHHDFLALTEIINGNIMCRSFHQKMHENTSKI